MIARIAEALDVMDEIATTCDTAGMNANAHELRRAVRIIREELTPPAAVDEEPVVSGEWPDLMFVVRPS